MSLFDHRDSPMKTDYTDEIKKILNECEYLWILEQKQKNENEFEIKIFVAKSRKEFDNRIDREVREFIKINKI